MLEGKEKPTWHTHITGEADEGRKEEIELNEGKLSDFLKQRVSDGEGSLGKGLNGKTWHWVRSIRRNEIGQSIRLKAFKNGVMNFSIHMITRPEKLEVSFKP